MFFKARLGRQHFTTDVAHEWLLRSGMLFPEMTPQGSFKAISLLTKFALVPFLQKVAVFVHLHVLFEVGFVAERLLAYLARVDDLFVPLRYMGF